MDASLGKVKLPNYTLEVIFKQFLDQKFCGHVDFLSTPFKKGSLMDTLLFNKDMGVKGKVLLQVFSLSTTLSSFAALELLESTHAAGTL